MRTPVRLGAYAAGLALVFVSAWGVGALVGPSAGTGQDAAGHDGAAQEVTGHDGADDGHGGRTEGGEPATVALPDGLQVARHGYRLVPVTRELATSEPGEFAFRILGPDGTALTRYTPTHERDLHLIVVRRDLSGFQHLHPAMRADGTWNTPLRVEAPGQYRVFADFQPAGRADGLTLGVDLPAPGLYQPATLPAPAPTATVDGYTVGLSGDLVPGTVSRLTVRISRDGAPVTDLQPYLAAYGHLVALRDGDLAYLHVHPDGVPGDGRTRSGPDLTFHVEVPSTGTYRLYLDFRHGDTVRTAEFTAVAGGAGHGDN